MITQATVLREQIVRLRSSIASDPIHDMRVAMKKLRTIARLLGDPSLLHPLRDLYRACGAVREPEVMSGVLSVLDRDTELKTRRVHKVLNEQGSSAREHLRAALDSTPDTTVAACLRALFDRRGSLSDSVVADRIKNRLRRRKKRACHRIEVLDDMEILHSVRKDLKQMNYLLMIDEGSQKPQGRRRRARVSDTEAFMGAIHDHSVLQAWLASASGSAVSMRDRDTLMAMMDRMISSETAEVKQRLRSLCAEW